ncbi:rCG43123 [Rattus norvegicus]|uniref:RCG43123 n=1 Tax=Rattus norvegicus TaxID=10116 RepID=A6IWU3_RAT|nr:rCG43123 [Rattus norvegicus]
MMAQGSSWKMKNKDCISQRLSRST